MEGDRNRKNHIDDNLNNFNDYNINYYFDNYNTNYYFDNYTGNYPKR